MSRELKFKAYDPETGQMTGGATLKYACEQAYEKGNRQADFEWDDNIVMLQYTGLKDKNGTEIYEGDIVKRTVFNYDYDEIDNPKVEKYAEQVSFIEYRNNGFWVNMENFGWEGENLWDWDLMEVIGNIYQNAELLTKTQIQ